MTAPVAAAEARRFRITHPFHPYCGQELNLIEQQGVLLRSTLLFEDEAGFLRRIPTVWTNLAPGDAFTEVAAGRAVLHADYLCPLAALLEQLRKKPSNEL